jgi:antirestriction protein ArdC
MKLYGKAEAVAQRILEAFEQGTVPRALAYMFIHREVECPTAAWSWRNRLLVALNGQYDARGYRQWQEVGRQVKKGEKACHILAPKVTRAKEDDEARSIRAGDPLVTGFIAVPVFGLTQTEGEALPHEVEDAAFIDALPLVEVARSWGLDVSLFNNAKEVGKAGFYRRGKRIALGVTNLSTWGHELMHAADHRLGHMANSEPLEREVVAELGSAVLLECLGYDTESDRGGVYAYIQTVCEEKKQNPISVCSALVDRVCACVAFILETAEGLADQGHQAATA